MKLSGGDSQEVSPVIERQDFFPRALLRTIRAAANAQVERKQTYQFVDLDNVERGAAPIALVNATRYARIIIRSELNTAILKRYDVTDDYVSRAYEFHPEPECFSQSKVVFCTIDGNANLEVKDVLSIDCGPNTAVVMDPDLEHKITPPQNESGIRHLLFLGNDYTLE